MLAPNDNEVGPLHSCCVRAVEVRGCGGDLRCCPGDGETTTVSTSHLHERAYTHETTNWRPMAPLASSVTKDGVGNETGVAVSGRPGGQIKN
ncbi:unnamed protein product [Schistocephalus solidus]|uniref:Uncharacterized protein n=1 Tax=Schistocephalus solidus TaxID=70667 RepID=A0A183SFW4_SCHSO|nr:unnamed protein product [Schistocephalus solidus]